MPLTIQRYARLLFLLVMWFIATAWLFSVHFDIRGMDAGYYFTAAQEVATGRNPYLSGDFLYPSLPLWTLVPAFGRMSITTLTVIFNLIVVMSVLALAGGTFVLTGLHPWARKAPGLCWSYFWLPPILLAMMLWSGATDTAVALGNISPLVGALCVWAGVLYRRDRFIPAAVMVALASIFKIIPALLLVFMFFAGYRGRNRRLMLASAVGGALVLAGIFLPPFGHEFLSGAGGTSKWGVDIGGACISIHIWLARAFENPLVNTPEIAVIVFGTAAAAAALYGLFSRAGSVVAWITVMVLADIGSPKNCPHLYMAMTFPVIVKFARYMAETAGHAEEGSRRLLRVLLAAGLPMIAFGSEFFYFRGDPFGELILPIVPILLVAFEALELNSATSSRIID